MRCTAHAHYKVVALFSRGTKPLLHLHPPLAYPWALQRISGHSALAAGTREASARVAEHLLPASSKALLIMLWMLYCLP